MADEQLKDHVLQRADDDEDLSERARLVVRAAWRDLPADAPLSDALGKVDTDVETLARCASAASTAPRVADVEHACAALRSAAVAQAEAECTADALSADRIQFLETSLEFHDRHGTQPCPVCATGTLDDEWVVQARDALAAERAAASVLRVARSGAHRARQELIALVRAVEAPPAEDAAPTSIPAARVAHQSFAALPSADDTALAEHVADTLPGLLTSYDALVQEAVPSLAGAREAQQWLRTLASSTPS
jgi:hypothetical protein